MLFTSEGPRTVGHQLPHVRTVPTLRISEGERIVLAGPGSTIEPVVLTTNDLDEYKSWIGVANEDAPPLTELERFWKMPDPWPGVSVAVEDLSLEALAMVDAAAWLYVFGDSRPVSSYREITQKIAAPFTADVYAVDEVEVLSGGRLVVRERPAILRFNRVTLHETGRIETFAPTRALFHVVQKAPAAVMGVN